MPKAPSWQDKLYDELKSADVRQIPFVPDAGHSRLIQRFESDPNVKAIRLSSEQEGIAVLAGAWLGGERGVLLMQSSGVGNCVNMLALAVETRFPLFMLVTMRGDEGEFNGMQVPMGQGTPRVLRAMGVIVQKAGTPREVVSVTRDGMRMAYNAHRSVAVLIRQSVIGAKDFRKLTRAGEKE